MLYLIQVDSVLQEWILQGKQMKYADSEHFTDTFYIDILQLGRFI